jgi:hypothetical protein
MAGSGFGQPGTYTPLQLIAGAGLLQNQGISVPTSLTTAVSSYNSLTFVQDLMSTISLGPGFGLNAGVIASLKTLGNTTCPALGASIPSAYAGVNPLIPTTETGGFGNLVTDNAALYLGDGELDRFCQAYQIVVGYRGTANELIQSAVNATTYLGPTFTTMNDLITGQFTSVNLALKCLGRDLAQLGNAINLAKLDDFGTPAAVLQQLSDEAKITAGTLSCVALKLAEYGLTESDIVLLCTPDASNRTPSMNEFNALQKKAYSAMAAIDSDCLTYVLDVLGVVTPNIGTMADLLDLKKILPESWISLTVQSTAPPPTPPSPGSPPSSELTTNPLASLILIFNTDGSVNPVLQAASGSSSDQIPATLTNSQAIALPGGCDELAKIIPPDQAVANKAFQAGLQNVGGISTTTLPRVATALLG